MNEAKKQKIITELKNFYKELRSYKSRQLRKHKTKFTEAQKRSLDALRSKLERKHGQLHNIISKYGGSAFVPILDRKYEVFTYTLTFLDLDIRGFQALDAAIGLVNRAIGKLESTPIAELELEEIKAKEPPKAFISHGKESAALRKLREFIETLGIEPLIVKKKASLDRDLPDKVNLYLNQADFVIILATSDDTVKDKITGKEIIQPRQNVIHEIGLAQKTHSGRIIYLLEEGAEFPSNIRPRVWESFKQRNMMDAFLGIVRELRAYGMLKIIKTPPEEQKT